MVSPEVLTQRIEREEASPACPRCGEMPGAMPRVPARIRGIEWLRRCPRCGTRSGFARDDVAFVFTCDTCGLPFAADRLLPHAEHRCPRCAAGKPPADLPTREIAAAAEAEILQGLAGRWRFVRSSGLDLYLARLARQVAGHVEGAPTTPRVILVDDGTQRALALPSGLILLSVGVLRFLEDEAELVFVLAHELAHASSGDAAVRLVRHGFHATQAAGGAPEPAAWGDAAEDLVRLGYGRKRERDADARALEAMTALHYETESALRYLRRLQERTWVGDATVAELALAHPPAADRLRRIEKALYGRPGSDADRKVNREVFRRAVTVVLAEPLPPVDLLPTAAPAAPIAEDEDLGPRWGVRIAWTMAVVAAAAGAIVALAYLLG